jgi:hypothetical protein
MWRSGAFATAEVMASAMATVKGPNLKLFPQKVKSDATVYAVFAIE